MESLGSPAAPPRPTTTVPNVVDLAGGPESLAPPADDGTPAAVWMALAAGVVAMAAILRRELGRPG